MNEQQIGYRVKQVLDQGLSLETATLSRLKTARELALARQCVPIVSPSKSLVWAGNMILNAEGPRFIARYMLLPTILLILGMFIANDWYQAQRTEEIVEIDAAVLTGELPIDAYLDKGFGAWLKSSLE